MPRTLTARNVATLPAPSPDSKSRQIDYWDIVEEGLALRVSTTHRAWIVRYRVDGRRRRLTLGDLLHHCARCATSAFGLVLHV